VGEVVQVGSGKQLWRIVSFWLHGETQFADLQNVDREWVKTSSVVERLTLVEAHP
jgi:hypothetical protein